MESMGLMGYIMFKRRLVFHSGYWGLKIYCNQNHIIPYSTKHLLSCFSPLSFSLTVITVGCQWLWSKTYSLWWSSWSIRLRVFTELHFYCVCSASKLIASETMTIRRLITVLVLLNIETTTHSAYYNNVKKPADTDKIRKYEIKA